MTDITDNTLIYLRALKEKNAEPGHFVHLVDLISLTQLSLDELSKIDRYLLIENYVSGKGGAGPDAVRYLTEKGMIFIRQSMMRRLPLTLDAERVLKYLVREIGQSDQSLDFSDVASYLGMGINRLKDACVCLENTHNLIKWSFDQIELSISGQQAVLCNFMGYCSGLPSASS
jgi:hypothetical protein